MNNDEINIEEEYGRHEEQVCPPCPTCDPCPTCPTCPQCPMCKMCPYKKEVKMDPNMMPAQQMQQPMMGQMNTSAGMEYYENESDEDFRGSHKHYYYHPYMYNPYFHGGHDHYCKYCGHYHR